METKTFKIPNKALIITIIQSKLIITRNKNQIKIIWAIKYKINSKIQDNNNSNNNFIS